MPIDRDAARALRARAEALARTPTWLRSAKDGAPAFEERAVKAVVARSGLGSLAELKAEARRRDAAGRLTFAVFHDLVPFPVRLVAGRLRFHFDGAFADLVNDPANTPIWSAYADAREKRPKGVLGLVFAWPRVRRCANLVVFHDADRDESALAGVTKRKDDPRLGFRLTVPIAGRFYHLEPLPAFLFGVGVYAAKDGGDERGAE